MVLSVRQTQTQALALTPQVLQSVRLLRMSSQELADFVASELERNPFLKAGPRKKTGAAALPAGDFLAGIASPVSLREHVEEQILFRFRNARERWIARELADRLDPDGYLREEMETLCHETGAAPDEIGRVLSQCRQFSPSGLFARHLSDCLALQLASRDRLDPAMQALLARLDLVAKRDWKALMRVCAVDEEDLAEMLAEVRALDPKPGSAFRQETVQPLIADLVVSRATGGGWLVELNPESQPQLLLDREYRARLAGQRLDGEAASYVAGCVREANWLVRNLERRGQTLLRIAAEIVRVQEGFLLRGMRDLRPLTRAQIAEATGMHETTVSRAVAGKYMATPAGIVELRLLFSASLAGTNGSESVSAQSVRQRIREMVAAEAEDKVLSDAAIAGRLRDDGISIARRTVAKYREELQIPPAARRRRKALAAA